MNERDLLRSVDQARQRLNALRSRLEDEGAPSGTTELASGLGDLEEMLEKLQSASSLLGALLERTSDAVFAKDRDGRYVMINSRGAGMFGRSVAQVLGEDDTALCGREDAERIMALDREVMTSGQPRTLEETLDFQGIPLTLLTTKTAWFDPQGELRGLIGTSQDVTQRRRVEREVAIHQDRLRSMAVEIVMAEEHLRRSLGAELHNGLGQDIALVKMRLSLLRRSANAELHDPLTGIEQLVQQADRSVRSIAFQISPPVLYDLGLLPALQWLVEDVGDRYGLDVRIECNVSPEIADHRIRVLLFRAVRELLVDAATHGGAGAAVVRLGQEDGLLCIIVQDEDAAFDTTGGGFRSDCLFGIREQLRHVRASLHIDSTPGHGTKVTLVAPLETEHPAGR